MIPASYLFKDIYHQQWEEPEEVPATRNRNRRFLDGLATPIAATITALFAHRPQHDRPLRRRVYE